MKRILQLLAVVVIAAMTGCNTDKNDSSCSCTDHVLKFHENGTFKIVQFTDTHVIYGNPKSCRALDIIQSTIESEKPDLVVFTGDQIFGKPGKDGLNWEFSILEKANVPFAYAFGNHDREQEMTGKEIWEFIQKFNCNVLRDSFPEVDGISNGIIPVLSSKDNSTAAVVYIFDSQTYSTLGKEEIKGYGWIKRSQINWYSENSRKFTENNNGIPVPSVAFFHIPLPEYKEAIAAKAPMVGILKENVCSPEINTGLFAEMKERGDVFATFVGHDHDNNCAIYWKGTTLCYGSYSGGNTVYNNVPCGARVIELHEGKPEAKTWIHYFEGNVEDEIVIPEYFNKLSEQKAE